MPSLKMFVAQFYYFMNRSYFGFGYFAMTTSYLHV